ncbi:MAG: arsenate reductase ArsC [Clostridium sp.]|uniref:arsenate reductase ArsC n=1 Tax=Clostridium sp. TaxID=1506 RepID=UPI002FC9E273
MIKVGFICVHNSCRSQMAEALGKLLASDCFESYSAGTEVVDRINSDGVKIMKKLYGVDMDKNHYSKTLDDIPDLDVVIKMGCNVMCPIVPNVYMEDWGIEDPTGKGEEEFLKTAKLIEEKVISLKNRINTLKI